MCGFVGCVVLAGRRHVRPGWDARAIRLIRHRGPDDEGAFADAVVSLRSCRLAVLDPGVAGHQPMSTADGRYWIAFNGELYNNVELTAELLEGGADLRGRCDTEIVLELFCRHGADVVHRLRGMFAFAVWDRRHGELFAARDRFGVKPFFYRHDDDSLRFSSEKKALVDPDGDDLNVDALRRYLAMQYVPGPETLSTSVRALPPGHILRARPGSAPEVVRYWSPTLGGASSNGPNPRGAVLDVLRESVRVHLRSDVPVGALLSGGVDSALICALAAEHVPKLPTFTVGFNVAGYSEIHQAEETAAFLGLDNDSFIVSVDDFVDELPRIVWHLDDPLGDAAAVPLWFLARHARRKVTCVLSGEGADELFGGYHVYRQHGHVRVFDRVPQSLRRGLQLASRAVPVEGELKRLTTLAARRPERRYIGADEVYFGEDVDLVSRVGHGSAHDLSVPAYTRAKLDGLDDVARMQLLDIEHWLPGDILVKADRMTMAHGLELRVPFLDRDVMTVAGQLTRAEKIQQGTTKWLLRQAAARVLPPSVAFRPKLGFPVPIRHWLRGELFGFADDALRTAETDAYLRRDVAVRLLDEYRRRQHDDWRRVWVLVCFSVWHQIFMERKYDPSSLGWIHEASPSTVPSDRPEAVPPSWHVAEPSPHTGRSQ